MAIFVDAQQNHYIGLLYLKDGDRYTGNFMRPPKWAVVWLDRLLAPITKVLAVMTVLAVLTFAFELASGPTEYFNYAFAAMAGIGCLVIVAYAAICPVMLIRRKSHLSKVKLDCNRDLSRRMYLLPLVDFLLVGLSLAFLPGFTLAEDGIFMLVFLGPIVAALVLAIVYYAKVQ